MVTPIDAVRYAVGFDQAGQWHEAASRIIRSRPLADDSLSAARGALIGLLLSGLLWGGLFLAARAVLHWLA